MSNVITLSVIRGISSTTDTGGDQQSGSNGKGPAGGNRQGPQDADPKNGADIPILRPGNAPSTE
jgi:hypothetical protein